MKYYKYKMNLVTLNIVASIFTLLLMILYFILFGSANFGFSTLIYIVLWLFLHEIIHGLAFMAFPEVNNKNVTYGAKLESGIFYCMCKQRISKKVIYTSLLAPFTVIGVITLIIAVIFNLKTLGILSLFNIAGAIGDLLMTFMFMKMPKDIIYMDLDDCEGFTILSKEDLSKNKYFGFKLIEYGNDNKDLTPKDFKKINCSKISFVILVFILILFILSLFVKF